MIQGWKVWVQKDLKGGSQSLFADIIYIVLPVA